jgi:predicted RNase H-like HicB family nuclease
MDMKTLTAVVRKEDRMFVAQCPEIGTTSQGHTLDEALANLKEATELYLEEFPQKGSHRPIVTTFEVDDDAKA